MSSRSIEQLTAEWEQLRKELYKEDNVLQERLPEIQGFLKECRLKGAETSEPAKRAQLQSLCRDIGDAIFTITTTYPNVTIRPGPPSVLNVASATASQRLQVLYLVLGISVLVMVGSLFLMFPNDAYHGNALGPIKSGKNRNNGELVSVSPASGPLVAAFQEAPENVDDVARFGIVRPDEPEHWQWIEYSWERVALSSRTEPTGFLVLSYNVSGRSTYNGFWYKLGHADWTKYYPGDLVLRLRQFAPRDERPAGAFDPDTAKPIPDRGCTDTFKVELKVVHGEKLAVFPFIARVGVGHKIQQQELGYFDLHIPMAELIDDKGQLKIVSEFVIVFEHRRIPPDQQRGNLGIHAIALTTKHGDSIDDVLPKQDDFSSSIDPLPRASAGKL